ncbi:MAG: ABC transporter permease [Pseudomonadota bacterium]|nr:ABC transporter permease [Pseudomonadota bacterium]
MGALEAAILTVITAATPLLFAAIGELVTERSGVLNLGLEGMMAVGAVTGFAVALSTGNDSAGVLAAALAGMVLAALFAALTLRLATSQVATGLALTLLGLGLSGLIGEAFVGKSRPPLPKLHVPGLSDLPLVGRVLFGQDVLVYLSFALVIGVSYVLWRTRAGLVLRAVGDSHGSAHALGYPVLRIRFLATLFGGACAGLGGAFLSLVYTPHWSEAMTAGRGWIALALVVFASWIPWRAMLGAYLFGAVTILQFYAQGAGVGVPSQFLSSLPYLATILVLVVTARDRLAHARNAPACLGQPFVAER